MRVHWGSRRGKGVATGQNPRVEGVSKILSGVAHKHPQSPYAGLKKSLQQEWDFVQRVTPEVGDAFVPVEEALKEIFVPVLYQVLWEGVLERGITRLPVKQAVLALPDPTQTSPEN